MNISYNWLRDLLPMDEPAAHVAEALTSVGLAVEGIHLHGDDSVFDIDLTSNRPDCLSHLGVARELGAVFGRDLNLPVSGIHGSDAAGELASISDPELCPRFTARIVRNVKVGPSPEWLVARLEAIGERSINNVADITNYVMHEFGQPMHAFDYDKLAGGQIVVRRAAAGETIRTLDGVDRELDPSILLICDPEKPAAVAGIMGGFDSSITDQTTTVLIEVAYFDRKAIRSASRKLNLATEASYRFERGVDVENLEPASARAASLIAELCSGNPGEFIDLYPNRQSTTVIDSPNLPVAVKRLSGLDVDADECVRILSALGVVRGDVNEGDRRSFVSPPWRHDLAIEADLVEEIVRHKGLDSIAVELPPSLGAGEYQPTEARERRLRQTLTANGFSEAISYSFIDTKFDDAIGFIPGLVDASEEPFVTLEDSIIEGSVRMRASALPGLLEAVRLNFNQQRRDQKLFEIGRVFSAADSEDGLPNESKVVALVITGSELEANRSAAARGLDFYDLKGMVETALEAAGTGRVELEAASVKHLKEGQSAAIVVYGKVAGWIGAIGEDLSTAFKFRQPVFAAELNLTAVLAAEATHVVYKPLAKYPGIQRDISFVAERRTEFGMIKAAILDLGIELCRSVEFVDIYEGKGLDANQRSITIRLEYRSDERTLIEDEVEELNRTIIETVEKVVGAKVRFG